MIASWKERGERAPLLAPALHSHASMEEKSPKLARFIAARLTALVLSTFVLGGTGHCAALELSFDYEAAQQLMAALDDQTLESEEARRLSTLPGIQAMIEKAHEFDPAGTPEAFVRDVVSVAHGAGLFADPFQLMHVREHSSEVRSVLAALVADPETTVQHVAARVTPFQPAGCSLAVRVLLTAGGTSDGWSLPAAQKGPQRFAVALDQFRGDLSGLQLLMAHELFHNVQSCARPYDYTEHADEGPKARVMGLLQSLEDEGTASLVGDAMAWPDGGAYVDWFRGKFRRNLDRLPSIVTLFTSLLYRANYDPQAKFDDLYGVAFTGGWDSNAYFLGYHMAQVIDGRLGRPRLIALLSQSPAQFVTTYMSVAKSDEPRFSADTLALIRAADAATSKHAHRTSVPVTAD